MYLYIPCGYKTKYSYFEMAVVIHKQKQNQYAYYLKKWGKMKQGNKQTIKKKQFLNFNYRMQR